MPRTPPGSLSFAFEQWLNRLFNGKVLLGSCLIAFIMLQFDLLFEEGLNQFQYPWRLLWEVFLSICYGWTGFVTIYLLTYLPVWMTLSAVDAEVLRIYQFGTRGFWKARALELAGAIVATVLFFSLVEGTPNIPTLLQMAGVVLCIISGPVALILGIRSFARTVAYVYCKRRPTLPLEAGWIPVHVRGRGNVWAPLHSIEPGPVRHESLSDEQLQRIRNLADTFSQVNGGSFEHWCNNFKHDMHPDAELAIWERGARAFSRFCDGRPLSNEVKREVYKVIIRALLGLSDQNVMETIGDLKYITKNDVLEILKGF